MSMNRKGKVEMAKEKVTITTTDGNKHEVVTSGPEASRFYEDLPFSSSNVSSVFVSEEQE